MVMVTVAILAPVTVMVMMAMVMVMMLMVVLMSGVIVWRAIGGSEAPRGRMEDAAACK